MKSRPVLSMKGCIQERSVVSALLVIHVFLLAHGAVKHSATWDEVAHLSAGISHWDLGEFSLYNVNPPLVRMVATIPVVCSDAKRDWSSFQVFPGGRPEFAVGQDFFRANGPNSFQYLTWARWCCLPFSLIGALTCRAWATRLYSRRAGLMSLCLWCFSPNVLAHAQMITPDTAATSIGLLANYVFWLWSKHSTWQRAIFVGALLGLAILSKTTWLLLVPLWPCIWLFGIVAERPVGKAILRQSSQLIVVFVVAIYVINALYSFENTFRRLDSFEFVSRPMSGTTDSGPNRFAGTIVGCVRIPLPANFILGIDLQKSEFERGYWSYLRGEWLTSGWWYYYLYALLMKVPLGTWGLGLLAIFSVLLRKSPLRRDEIILLAPGLAVLTLVSSQTGFNHHLRYVLPTLPVVFIWVSRVAPEPGDGASLMKNLVAVLTIWSINSSLFIYPHNLSYFNEMAGGPMHGANHLSHSNVDWGQDLLYLKRWFDMHPEIETLGLAYDGGYDPALIGMTFNDVPSHAKPGFYALSVNRIRSHDGRLRYFTDYQQCARIGYSMKVYHLEKGSDGRIVSVSCLGK